MPSLHDPRQTSHEARLCWKDFATCLLLSARPCICCMLQCIQEAVCMCVHPCNLIPLELILTTCRVLRRSPGLYGKPRPLLLALLDGTMMSILTMPWMQSSMSRRLMSGAWAPVYRSLPVLSPFFGSSFGFAPSTALFHSMHCQS